ncbi:TSUP family transporter [Paenibacillus sp. 8b26]|uniref:TSUP family transporter n=1 Tax=Paenibacillus sp. 8b26 TaxID=3424133 RepID=UPI003D64FE6E
MDTLLYGVMVLLGLIGSFFSGLLGIGGAIINYPLLLFVPAGLGIAHFSAQEVSTISMFQVFFASLAGVFMLTVLKIPTRTTIASSLAIVFISAIGGVIGKISTGHIPVIVTVFTVLGSLIGAPLGSKWSSKMNPVILRYSLVVLILLTAIKIWSSILGF